jgi:hypothetical protein
MITTDVTSPIGEEADLSFEEGLTNSTAAMSTLAEQTGLGWAGVLLYLQGIAHAPLKIFMWMMVALTGE